MSRTRLNSWLWDHRETVAAVVEGKRALVDANRHLALWGIDVRKALTAARGTAVVRQARRQYEEQRLASSHPDEFPIGRSYPVFEDRNGEAGVASGHYFHQDLLVRARSSRGSRDDIPMSARPSKGSFPTSPRFGKSKYLMSGRCIPRFRAFDSCSRT